MRPARFITKTASLALAATVLSSAISAPASAEPARYEIDQSHFSVVFNADHIGYGATWGMFLRGDGSFVFDEEARTLSDLTVTIEADSVFSNDERRDNHLRSNDFLAAEENPEIVFTMTSAEETGEWTGKVMGNLTLRGVSKPVTLDVTWNKSGEYPFGPPNYVIGITAETVLKRSEWGMTYAVDNGLVGDEVPIIIELEAIRQEGDEGQSEG